jgi:hypothetical protein
MAWMAYDSATTFEGTVALQVQHCSTFSDYIVQQGALVFTLNKLRVSAGGLLTGGLRQAGWSCAGSGLPPNQATAYW